MYAVIIRNGNAKVEEAGWVSPSNSPFGYGYYFQKATGEIYPLYMQDNPKNYFYADKNVAELHANAFNEIG